MASQSLSRPKRGLALKADCQRLVGIDRNQAWGLLSLIRRSTYHGLEMKWEYMLLTLAAKTWFLGGAIDSQKLADRLNELGMDGWELVNIFDTNMLHGQTRDVIAVLKRPAVRSQ